jgi:hypothetical protein
MGIVCSSPQLMGAWMEGWLTEPLCKHIRSGSGTNRAPLAAALHHLIPPHHAAAPAVALSPLRYNFAPACDLVLKSRPNPNALEIHTGPTLNPRDSTRHLGRNQPPSHNPTERSTSDADRGVCSRCRKTLVGSSLRFPAAGRPYPASRRRTRTPCGPPASSWRRHRVVPNRLSQIRTRSAF